MQLTLKIEYAAFLLLGIMAFAQTGLSWWWFAGLFFLPDVSILGYLAGPKAGSYFYNLFHHFGIAVLCYAAGIYSEMLHLEVAGIILFSHAAFDRIMGYGLKYPDHFKHSHLGKIGK